MARPTIHDVAREAGVSPATVDRVLNARLPVRPETARRVAEAADALGYYAAGLIQQRLDRNRPHLRLGFLLQKPDHYFYQALAQHIVEAAASAVDCRVSAVIDHIGDTSPGAIAGKLRSLGERCRAIAAVCVDHPMLASAVAELKESGIPVFALLSDFAPEFRAGYVGLDNRKAGRTAAWLIAHAARKPGKVGVFVGSHRFLGQELREIGLRSYFREHAPAFEVPDSQMNLEEPPIAYEATLGLLRRHGDMAGLYVAGGGMEGVIAALRERADAPGLVAVCNELTPDSRLALGEGIVSMVIATPLPQLSAELIRIMAQACLSENQDIPGQSFLPFSLYLPENI